METMQPESVSPFPSPRASWRWRESSPIIGAILQNERARLLMMTDKPILAITMGDVNGVGPEVLVKALSHEAPWELCRPVVVGSVDAYEAARRLAPQAPSCVRVESVKDILAGGRVAPVLEGGIACPPLRPGTLDARAGKAAVQWIQLAVELVQQGGAAGMVTCPVNKECMQQAGCPHPGHTTLIAEMTGTRDYCMSLFAERMRIVHVSGHLSLREAVAAVKRERIARAIRIGHEALLRIGVEGPRIAVAGLNPHAGEAGAFGAEEREEIAPAVAECRDAGIPCSGPYPPDTVFKRMREGEFDMVISMYHDQGHIPLKLVAMDEGVNVTLGLPIVRTSVDHGTAFDIAGKGVAREHSLLAAIRLAAQLVSGEAVKTGSPKT